MGLNGPVWPRQDFAQDDCFAFARHDDEETLVAVLNVATEPRKIQLPVGAYFGDGVELRPVFGPGSGSIVHDSQVTITLPACEALLLGG